MENITIRKPASMRSFLNGLLTLILVFAFIILSVLVLQLFLKKDSSFKDGVIDQISQEMSDNQIVLSSGTCRRTIVDFKDPIIMTHGKDSRLIVHTAHLTENISISSEGFGGWSWTSSYQEIEFTGDAQYTVDLSKLSDKDFAVNNEAKTLTVRIPYAVLSPINIPDDQIKFHDVKKGWAGPKDIKLTVEENAQLKTQVNNKMKATLIDNDTIASANESAKAVVADLLSATVQSIDPDFTVVVVQ